MLGAGSLEIQTAGVSGSSTPEHRVAGLGDAHAVYETVAAQLRRFRGGLSSTAVGKGEEDTMRQILTELRAIRQAVEKRGR